MKKKIIQKYNFADFTKKGIENGLQQETTSTTREENGKEGGKIHDKLIICTRFHVRLSVPSLISLFRTFANSHGEQKPRGLIFDYENCLQDLRSIKCGPSPNTPLPFPINPPCSLP